jgi:hypothetical protein
VFRKLLVPVTLSAALLVGVSAGVAGAATPNAPAATTHVRQGTSNGARRWLRAHRRQLRRAVVVISSKTIGISAQDLVSELRSGKSIADVAAEHSVNAQTVSDALLSAATAKVNQAVTNHKLTSARATKIEAALPGYISKLVDHVFGPKAARSSTHTAG